MEELPRTWKTLLRDIPLAYYPTKPKLAPVTVLKDTERSLFLFFFGNIAKLILEARNTVMVWVPMFLVRFSFFKLFSVFFFLPLLDSILILPALCGALFSRHFFLLTRCLPCFFFIYVFVWFDTFYDYHFLSFVLE